MTRIQEEYEQRYDKTVRDPMQVWLYCRLCRCRIQVRTIPRPDLPFRCFCGTQGTFAKFDVFADEEEVRRFAQTFEQLYQETKALLLEAEMPMPATRIYKADEIRRLKAGLAADEGSEGARANIESSDEPPLPIIDANQFRQRSREMTDAVQRAPDVLARHEALTELGRYCYQLRSINPEARKLCFQACEHDVQLARETLKEATARWKRGERIVLKFSLFKRLITLLCEDKDYERALEVGMRAVSLGLPGYEERVEKLRSQVARRAGG